MVRMGDSRMIIVPTSRSWREKTPRPFPGLGRMVYMAGGPAQEWSGDCHDIVWVGSDVEGIRRVDIAVLARSEDRTKSLENILGF